MKIAYVLFEELTSLDFVGFYDPIQRLRSQGYVPDLETTVCALTPTVRDNFGLEIKAAAVAPDLSAFDLIFLPGGFGTRALQTDPTMMEWLATAADVPYKVSVCTGSLLLGAAGFLRGRRATTHFNEYDALRPYCAEVVKQEVVVADGDVITAGAVASSLPLGLYVCERLAGAEAAEQVRRSMAYVGR